MVALYRVGVLVGFVAVLVAYVVVVIMNHPLTSEAALWLQWAAYHVNNCSALKPECVLLGGAL